MEMIKFFLKIIYNSNLPIIKRTVLFKSFFGQYSDNPKYISEQLHQEVPNINIVWVCGEDNISEFPDYVTTVKMNSDKYIEYISRAEIVVDNYAGCRSFFTKRASIIKTIIFKIITSHRKRQLNISTWHGTPMKHIALDEPIYQQTQRAKAFLCTDILLCGNEVTANAYRSALKWNGKILMCGSPRNDILFQKESDVLKKRLGLPLDKKVVLYAPTFRNSIEMSGLAQLQMMNIDELLKGLSYKFGGEWIFIFRCHNMVMEEIKKRSSDFAEQIINGNMYPDMAEYLGVTDVLLTDYSSCMFDFALTNKPCFLLTPDLYEYENGERGFYFGMDKVPFAYAKDFEGLLNNILEFDKEKHTKKVEGFLKFVGNVEQGNAAKEIVKIIQEFID